ncbi:MAG: hypothetical protein KDE19_17835 [Caldilineaceae bacterium]|nr:hypothetical protein [Caldilineaceae bacterium]
MTEFTTEELKRDLADTQEDIKRCERALQYGVSFYSVGGVQARLDTNKRIAAKISLELMARGEYE